MYRVLPNFKFPPLRLSRVCKVILDEIPEGRLLHVSRIPSGPDLETILQRLRQTPANKVLDLATSLSSVEIDVLSSRFAEILTTDTAKRRASTIILARWKRRFSRNFWAQFQCYYSDPELPRLIREGLRRRQYSRLEDTANDILDEVLRASSPLHSFLELITSSNRSITFLNDSLDIARDSPLFIELLRRYFLTAVPAVYLYIETPTLIDTAFRTLWQHCSNDYCAIVERYLTIVAAEQYQDFVMENILELLGEPDDSNPRWSSIGHQARTLFSRWLNERIVSEFFKQAKDNERFQFWKRYTKNLQQAKVISVRKSHVVFLVFERVVVVEFARHGNAAYIYSREYYEREFRDYALKKVAVQNESYLKHPSYIERIIHGGNWQYRWGYTLDKFMRSGRM